MLGRIDSIKNVGYLWRPKTNLYYVAATETMKSGLLPKIMAYIGAVSIKRTWRESGESIKRQVDLNDISNIGKALGDGWVITFPQGTTRSFSRFLTRLTFLTFELCPKLKNISLNV